MLRARSPGLELYHWGKLERVSWNGREGLTSFCPLLVHDPVTALSTTDGFPRFYLIFSAAILEEGQTMQTAQAWTYPRKCTPYLGEELERNLRLGQTYSAGLAGSWLLE